MFFIDKVKKKRQFLCDGIKFNFSDGYMFKNWPWQSREKYLAKVSIIIGDRKHIIRNGQNINHSFDLDDYIDFPNKHKEYLYLDK